MANDLTSFLRQLQSGVDVAVASRLPDKLLGVRDGFHRFFHDGLERPVPVSVAPHTPVEDESDGLPLSDDAILTLARQRALALQRHLGDAHTFYLGCEAGILTLEADGVERHFGRTWTVILGLDDEAWGSSGSLALPQRLIEGLDERDVPLAIPSTRRHGGIVATLTGGLEDRRTATAVATVHALATLLYGRVETRSPARTDRR